MFVIEWYTGLATKTIHIRFIEECSLDDIIKAVEEVRTMLAETADRVDLIFDFTDLKYKVPHRHLPRLVEIPRNLPPNLGNIYTTAGNPTYSRPLTNMIARLANLQGRLHYIDSIDHITAGNQ